MKEGSKLDKTLAMGEEIINMGRLSSQNMATQAERLKKTGRNLKKIEHSAVPGIDKLLGKINKVERKHKLIIAFVIAFCIAFIIYLQSPSLPTMTLSPETTQTESPSSSESTLNTSSPSNN